MLKRDELAAPRSCINTAAEDEPVFVLRAKDPLAAETVRFWCREAIKRTAHEHEKVIEAFTLAAKMDVYRLERWPERVSGWKLDSTTIAPKS